MLIVCDHCALQVPAHAYRHTLKAIEDAFGLPANELFTSIERQPVASGSIGQVHRAVLAPKGAAIARCQPGQVVAVKVRHPGAEATVLQDFSAMCTVARWVEALPALR